MWVRSSMEDIEKCKGTGPRPVSTHRTAWVTNVPSTYCLNPLNFISIGSQWLTVSARRCLSDKCQRSSDAHPRFQSKNQAVLLWDRSALGDNFIAGVRSMSLQSSTEAELKNQ